MREPVEARLGVGESSLSLQTCGNLPGSCMQTKREKRAEGEREKQKGIWVGGMRKPRQGDVNGKGVLKYLVYRKLDEFEAWP